MPTLARFSMALKALRQLGFTQVALNALYKFGLATGHYRRTIQPPAPVGGLQLQPILPLPARDEILAILGESGRAKLFAEADEIVAGKYRQFGGEPVEINLCPPAPLSHWTEYETGKVGATGRSPLPDIKFTWEPARFGFAFTLGRAYHLTGDECYAEAFWRYFETFTAANPPYLGPNWMSGQEVGLRLIAFTWAGQVFAPAKASTGERMTKLIEALTHHSSRISPTLLYARSQNNNHLLTEAAALYTAGLTLFGHPEASYWLKTGQKWLTWCFTHQIDAYGEYVQHSTNYHRLMLQTAVWLHVIASRWSSNPERSERRVYRDQAAKQSPVREGEIASLPPVARNDMVRENLALATHWLLSLLDPATGRVPNLGANDGAYIFPLTSLPFDDFRPVAQTAARAFLNYTLPPGPWDELALWFGLPRTEQQVEIPRYPGEHVYAPNSWGYLRAVRLKSRPSHADQLHFDLWWRGLNIAQDAGTYLYNAEPPWDNQLTSTLVHNTVSVDWQEQMTRVSRFLYLDWADATVKRETQIDGEFLQRASARTYAYAKVNVRHDRVVTVFRDERWRVEDELLDVLMPGRTPRLHTYRLHWLLPDWEWKIESRERGVKISLKSPLGWAKLAIGCEYLFPGAGGQATQPQFRAGIIRAGQMIYGDGLLAPVFGWVSPTYSVKIPALSLAVEVQSADSLKFITEFEFPIL